MAAEPAYDVTSQPLLGKDIPESFGLPRSAGHGAHGARSGVNFGETQNSMFVRPFSRCNRVPEHRGKNGFQRGEVRHDTLFKETGQDGHLAGIEQGMDHLPVRSVPTNYKSFLVRNMC